MAARPIVLGIVFALVAVVPTASQAQDHLVCHKMKDKNLAKAKYTATLDGLTVETGCQISVPGKLLCTPATKTAVDPPPPGGGGTGVPNTFVCYKVKCPKATPPPFQVRDQFGDRTVTPNTKPKYLCAPVGAPPSTTTSTTVTTTSTTSVTSPPTTSTTTTVASTTAATTTATTTTAATTTATTTTAATTTVTTSTTTTTTAATTTTIATTTTTTTTTGGSTTTTTLCTVGCLGLRSFTVRSSSATVMASHFYSSGNSGNPAEFSLGGFSGTLFLHGGAQDGNGVAPLRFAQDSTVGIKVLDNSFLCFRFDAAGSTGKIDCNGGQAVGVTRSADSMGASPEGPITTTIEQPPAGPAGAGYIVANTRIVHCPAGAPGPGDDPSCIGTLTNAASCNDPTKVNFALHAVESFALTTGTGTGTVTNAVQGGTVTLSHTGEAFSCAAWTTTDGVGGLDMPIVGFDDPTIGDSVNVMHLEDF